jgi:para-nitrobenzyl esterase
MGGPEVDTRCGRLRGTRVGEVDAFLGIPFARPPLGALRFAPPEPAEAWSGVRDATRLRAVQPQTSDAFIARLGLDPLGPQDEDCLHLNVWTPAADGARRPVLVWIHGGAFIGGTACTPLYDGARLAARGVVVVTLNYRVGLLGFLHADGVPANLGLRDQLAALAWVQREITRFGGDPASVTVFGESAGAGSLCALLAMPAARGLFRRAIVQSAAPDGMIDAAEARRRADLLLARLGVARGDVAGLRALGIEAILRAQAGCAAEDGPFTHNMLFVPVIDGDSLPQRPLDAIRAGSAREVQLVIGTTEEELGLYATQPAVRAIDEPRLIKHLERVLGPHTAGALAAYREARRGRGAGVSPAALFSALESDRSMRVPAIRLAEYQRAWQPRTYMYLFSWRSPLDAGALGSCHALDLPFTFGTLDARGMREFAGAGLEARRLSDALIDAWIAFARCGDPSHPGIGSWPAYDAAERITMQLGPTCGAVRAPLEAERRVWASAQGGG